MHQIEKKYLLNNSVETLIDDLQLTKQKILEFYIVVRVCKKVKYSKIDSKYYKITKFGVLGSKDQKITEVSKKRYKRKEKNCIGNIISKDRYLIQESGEKYFVDKYNNKLENIYILEVDFKKRGDKYNFVLPDIFKNFMVKDVTRDELYQNDNLALLGNPINNSYNIYTIFKDIEMGRTTNLKKVLFKEMKTVDAVRIVLYKLFIDLKISHDRVIQTEAKEGLKEFSGALKVSRVILEEYKEIFDKKIIKKARTHLKLLNAVLKREKDLQFIKNELQKMDMLIEANKMQKIQENIDTSISLERGNIRQFLTTREVAIIFKQYELLLKESNKIFLSVNAQIPIDNNLKSKIFTNYKKIIMACKEHEGCIDSKSNRKIEKLLIRLNIVLQKFDMIIEKTKNTAMKKSVILLLKKLKDLEKLKKKSLIAQTYLENIEPKTDENKEILKIVKKESQAAILQKSQAFKDTILNFKKQKFLFKP